MYDGYSPKSLCSGESRDRAAAVAAFEGRAPTKRQSHCLFPVPTATYQIKRTDKATRVAPSCFQNSFPFTRNLSPFHFSGFVPNQHFWKPAWTLPEQTAYLDGKSQVQKKKARSPNRDGKVWEKISFAPSLLRMIKSPAAELATQPRRTTSISSRRAEEEERSEMEVGRFRLPGSGIQTFLTIWDLSGGIQIFWSMIWISKKIWIPFRI